MFSLLLEIGESVCAVSTLVVFSIIVFSTALLSKVSLFTIFSSMIFSFCCLCSSKDDASISFLFKNISNKQVNIIKAKTKIIIIQIFY